MTADFNAIATDILERAALVHRFDPLAMMPDPIEEVTEARALTVVAQNASEVEWVDPKNPERRLTLWRLNPAARRSQLARLVAEGKLQDAIKRSSPQRGDKFATYLQAALTGKLKVDSVPKEDRDTAAVAADFASEALANDLAIIARQAAASLRSLLSQQSQENRSSAILSGKLIGRSEEQAALTAFVETGAVPERDRLRVEQPPMGPYLLTNAAGADKATRAIEARPYLLTGTPGAGKSALVADLVRGRRGYPIIEDSFDWTLALEDPLGAVKHAASAVTAATVSGASALAGLFTAKAPPANAPTVLLDFDRPGIALGGPLEWTAETSHQLGYGRPELAKKLGDMRARVRQGQLKFDSSGLSVSAILAATSDMKTGLADELAAAGLAGGVLVLVLDTFEEVVVRSPVATDEQIPGSLLGRVLIWADSLAALRSGDIPTFSAVRVLASGREKPDLDNSRLARWFAGHRMIGDLDPDAAVEFLRKRDSTKRFSAKLARTAVEKIGGHPLTLILLELYARNLKPAEITKTIEDANIGTIMGAKASTQVLYSQFLQRFHHDLDLKDGVTAAMVTAVAYPGLVLREITPDLLREVICPACGFDAISPDTAKALFERLRTQVWLVSHVEGKDAIRHRGDVRRLMLPMMTGDPDATASKDLRTDDPDATAASKDLRDKMLQVHRAAAAWYDKTAATDDSARLEALYHRAFLPADSLWSSVASLPEAERAPLLRRVAESAGDDLRVMPIAARAPLRFYSVGAGRMTPDEVAALPQELGRTAGIDRLDLKRRVAEPRAASAPEAEAASSNPPSETPEMATVSTEATASEEMPAEPLVRPAGSLNPRDLFELVNDHELASRIGYAFTTGDFDTAAGIGWDAIASLSAFPDLTHPIRFAETPTTHWFWQSALATLATDRGPPSDLLEQYLRRFAESVDSRRATADAAGLVFAAATTFALGRVPSPETLAVTDKLAQIFQRSFRIVTYSDLRLLVAQILWRRHPQRPSEFDVRIPLNRIQLFSRDLFGLDFVRDSELESATRSQGFDAIPELIGGSGVSSDSADRFVTSNESFVSLRQNSGSIEQMGRLLVGVTPEIYDNAVRALLNSDNLSYGAVDRAIEQVISRASFWPADLVPGNRSWLDQDIRSGFLAKVIVHADRCGLLLPLLEAATKVNASKHLPRLVQLVRRYEKMRTPVFPSSSPRGRLK